MSTGYNAIFICERALDPLAQGLVALRQQFATPSAQSPRPGDLDLLLLKSYVDEACEWLRFNVSMEYGGCFNNTIAALSQRFNKLHYQACCLLNGLTESGEAIYNNDAIRLIAWRHELQLKASFPERDERPEAHEMPPDLRRVEEEFVNESVAVQLEIQKTSDFVRRVSRLVRRKFAAVATKQGDGVEAVVPRPTEEPRPKPPVPPVAARLYRYSDDFSSVVFFGATYTFSRRQAICVRLLWNNWENGTPELHQQTILSHHDIESNGDRLRDLFRDHPAWGVMIIPGSNRGSFRLNGDYPSAG